MPRLAQRYMTNGAGKGPGLGDNVTTSQYGGQSYSDGLVAMEAQQPTGTNAAGTATGTGSASTGTKTNAAVPLGPLSGGANFALGVVGVIFGLGLF